MILFVKGQSDIRNSRSQKLEIQGPKKESFYFYYPNKTLSFSIIHIFVKNIMGPVSLEPMFNDNKIDPSTKLVRREGCVTDYGEVGIFVNRLLK